MAGDRCPACGAPAERGQLVCLECGSRVGISRRPAPSWKAPLAISVLVVAVCTVAVLLALGAIDDNARNEVAAAPPRPAAAAPSEGGLVKRGELYAWPARLQGYTVALGSDPGRTGAATIAREAVRSTGAKVGVISAADFSSLPDRGFVVFAGRYRTRVLADHAASGLRGRFPSAVTRRVRR
jgi:hypothetical protein